MNNRLSIKRFVRHVWGLLRARVNAPLTAASLIAFLLTASAFVVAGVAPAITGGRASWFDAKAWGAALTLSWPAVMAAAYLKFSEKWKRQHVVGRRLRNHMTLRKTYASAAITELYRNLANRKNSAEDMQHCRESILLCVASHVADLLSFDESSAVTATLLDFSTRDTRHMRVVARSTREREVPKDYDSDRLVAWNAIESGEAIVEDDVRNDPRWAGAGRRSYASVMAIPVVLGQQAFGCLSLDCERPYAFLGKLVDIQVVLMPYIAVLALTYPAESVSYPCQYNASHLRLR